MRTAGLGEKFQTGTDNPGKRLIAGGKLLSKLTVSARRIPRYVSLSRGKACLLIAEWLQ
jgi:hypothetical protein